MKKLFPIQGLFIILMMFAHGCSAENNNSVERFSEGSQYSLLETPLPSESDKVAVVEFFSFGCPHCYSIEPTMQAWRKTMPDYVTFEAVPAYWNPYFELLAQAFYTAEVLKVEDKLHKSLFDAIHLQGKELKTEGALRDFFQENAVSNADFDKTFNSFAVKQKVKLAGSRFSQFKLRGVPAVVIGGKYLTDVRAAGSAEALPEIINYLIAKLKAEKSKQSGEVTPAKSAN